MQTTPLTIGSEYVKARYVQYTDGTFTQRAPISVEWAHLNVLGPLIRGVVGDNITIVLKNNADRTYTMIPHFSILEWKDTVFLNAGENATFTWNLLEGSGPSEEEPSTVVRGYYSHVNEVADVYSGLVGPIIVARAASIRDSEHGDTGIPNDVDREFVVYFSVTDENQSHYLIDSMEAKAVTANVSNATFVMSNMKHAING
jgi:FtsP/CotA-like multicopper oxidase with cupredoxin domain